jgi:hypothetical protein
MSAFRITSFACGFLGVPPPRDRAQQQLPPTRATASVLGPAIVRSRAIPGRRTDAPTAAASGISLAADTTIASN